MKKLMSYIVSGSLFTVTAIAGHGALAAEEVNVYSYRQPQLINHILKAFTEKTGIKANVLFAKKGLIERIKAEGENSPVDLLMTVDISRLDSAKEEGITQPVFSPVIDKNIPAKFRDPEGHWIGLTARARVVYASKDRVAQDKITYEELADPKWHGKICTRSGQHVYNLGLFSSMIAHKGEAEATKWLEGLRDNLARKPTGNDRSQVQAIFSGECDLSLGNTYYMGRMQTNDKKPEQKEWAKSVKLLFPNAEGRGTHVNISGVMLAKNAPNRENAIKAIEFLTSDEAQKLYADANFEYPLEPGIPVAERVKSWGQLHPDYLPLSEIAKNRKKASELVDIVGYNNGPQS